jgi:hypothetical protein
MGWHVIGEKEIMETFFSLQEFIAFTKAIIYGLIVLTLVAMPAFWFFLTERDED